MWPSASRHSILDHRRPARRAVQAIRRVAVGAQVAEARPAGFARHGQVAVGGGFHFPAIHVRAFRTQQQADLIVFNPMHVRWCRDGCWHASGSGGGSWGKPRYT